MSLAETIYRLAMNQNRGTLVEPILMKFSLPLVLLTAFFISSCADVEEPPPGARYRVSNYPPKREQYPPQQQPFNPNAPPPENTAAARGGESFFAG
jgi:hypothetical protein